MTMIKGTAPMRMKLEWDGTEQELIDFSDRESRRENGEEFGLDSLDLGDSMGFWLTETQFEFGELTRHDEKSGHTLQCTIEYDLFEWEGV